jgi:putative sterol carrier protein/NAD(P)-dependent dehydrogenase (short-subunit alcohol dehydrogenase family)
MLNTGKLAGKTLYITGASRGIGKAIALKAARDGANIVVAAKTAEPHPKLPGTIYTAAKEIEAAGGKALPMMVDVRDESSIQKSVEEAVKKFGGIDILINNASAISLTGTEATSMKKFDLMHSINTRGTFLVSKLCLPYLKASKNNPHILNLSPPLNLDPKWFKDTVAYTMAKYGMSMCVLGMSEEFKEHGIAVNALWPQTAIITAAMEMLGGKDISKMCRKVDIMSDAAYIILTRDYKSFTGNFVVDEAILREEVTTDFDQYAVEPGNELIPDGFLDNVQGNPFAFNGKAGVDAKITEGVASGEVAKMFKNVEGVLNEELVKKVGAVYAFNVKGGQAGTWFIDLKNGMGSVGSGNPTTGEADVTFTLNDADFVQMFQGKLKPTNAFMTGKLKLSGDMSKAMALEKMMKKMNTRGFHTSARMSGDAGGGDVTKMFKDVEGVLSEDLVKKVNAVYAFDIKGTEAGTWFIDLKNGAGAVGSGAPTSGPADCTFTLSDADFVQMFQGKLKPTNAFMTGKLKLSGDMAKAMALEKMMKKMNKREYHTSAAHSGVRHYATAAHDDRGPQYNNVNQIFNRIKEVANKDVVSKVNATFLFDIEGTGKYYVDLKTGEGSVSEGEPPVVPDVTINIQEDNMIKLFNREMKPATAFMTGQLKLSGDLSKAMQLEEVMKASRQFHTWTRARAYSTGADDTPLVYENVPQVFERIETICSAETVEQIKAIFVFDIEGSEKYFLDFKNGSGKVGRGDPDMKADVVIKMNEDNALKIFNRTLKPATAFMTGQITVSGDLSKAFALEKIMKKAREAALAKAK